MFSEASKDLGYHSTLELEPIPPQNEIMQTFDSFERLTRLRVKLRLPNPEVSKQSKHLYELMNESNVKEYIQDMRNEQGLSKKEGGLPRSSAEIAEGGYKDGEVSFEGIKGKKKIKQKAGGKATAGSIDGIKNYLRGWDA